MTTIEQPAALAARPLQRNVSRLTLQLVTYGLGDKFAPQKFEPVKNRQHTKPFGGLWASPVECEYGWREWCEAESWGDLSSRFFTEYTGRTLVIDSLSDLANVIWQDVKHWHGCPDYEVMRQQGIDAIYLTERGEHETRYSEPGLHGYDCECVLVMNVACLKPANAELSAQPTAQRETMNKTEEPRPLLAVRSNDGLERVGKGERR